MKNFNKHKYEVLKETEMDKKLKNFFKKMINITGEGYASITLSTEESIKDSLTRFSEDFDDVDEDEIIFALIKAALISNDYDSDSIDLAKQIVKEKKIDDLIFLIDYNFYFRKEITKNYMSQCLETNLQTYKKSYEENSTINNLLILNEYIANREQNKSLKK